MKIDTYLRRTVQLIRPIATIVMTITIEEGGNTVAIITLLHMRISTRHIYKSTQQEISYEPITIEHYLFNQYDCNSDCKSGQLRTRAKRNNKSKGKYILTYRSRLHRFRPDNPSRDHNVRAVRCTCHLWHTQTHHVDILSK